MTGNRKKKKVRIMSVIFLVLLLFLLFHSCGDDNTFFDRVFNQIDDDEIPLADGTTGQETEASEPSGESLGEEPEQKDDLQQPKTQLTGNIAQDTDRNRNPSVPDIPSGTGEPDTLLETERPPESDAPSEDEFPDEYRSITEEIQTADSVRGTELEFPLKVTAFPPDDLKCRAIEIVIMVPEGIKVVDVAGSRQISGAQMDWHVSERERVLRIAYLNPHTTMPMTYIRKEAPAVMASIRIMLDRDFEIEEIPVFAYERLLARNSEGNQLIYDIESSALVVYFE